MSSKKLVKLVKNAGAFFVRHGKGDHDIFERIVAGQRRVAPIQMGKQELRPEYSLDGIPTTWYDRYENRKCIAVND